MKKSKHKIEPKIYVDALHNIFLAMKGLRIFERFGFNLPKEEPTISSLKILTYGVEWEYDITRFDWYNNNGDSLTDFLPSGSLVNILENSISFDKSLV